MIALHRRSALPSAARQLARGLVGGLALLASLGLMPAQVSAGTWTTGGLTFSDEHGGTRLVGASGTGTRDDPIILLEEITGAVWPSWLSATIAPATSTSRRRWASSASRW
jgi:hypothetical protein